MYRCSECGTDYEWAHASNCQLAASWHKMQETFFMGSLDFLEKGELSLLLEGQKLHEQLNPNYYKNKVLSPEEKNRLLEEALIYAQVNLDSVIDLWGKPFGIRPADPDLVDALSKVSEKLSNVFDKLGDL